MKELVYHLLKISLFKFILFNLYRYSFYFVTGCFDFGNKICITLSKSLEQTANCSVYKFTGTVLELICRFLLKNAFFGLLCNQQREQKLPQPGSTLLALEPLPLSSNSTLPTRLVEPTRLFNFGNFSYLHVISNCQLIKEVRVFDKIRIIF